MYGKDPNYQIVSVNEKELLDKRKNLMYNKMYDTYEILKASLKIGKVYMTGDSKRYILNWYGPTNEPFEYIILIPDEPKEIVPKSLANEIIKLWKTELEMRCFLWQRKRKNKR